MCATPVTLWPLTFPSANPGQKERKGRPKQKGHLAKKGLQKRTKAISEPLRRPESAPKDLPVKNALNARQGKENPRPNGHHGKKELPESAKQILILQKIVYNRRRIKK